jgi:SAM-dependent methyltransferase
LDLAQQHSSCHGFPLPALKLWSFLERDPSQEELEKRLFHLRDEHKSRWRVLRSIRRSHEARQRLIYGRTFFQALHSARIEIIRTQIPEAETIVDLGGAAANDPRGALLSMGYPYRPKEIFIIDLPADIRFGSWKADENNLTTPEGIKIRYLHRSMADLSPLPGGSVDLVQSGQSIEHVSKEDARTVFLEVMRVLKPGGWFCLDTPNRILTRMKDADRFIHPEHKWEYEPNELCGLLEKQGFQIEKKIGICQMKRSLKISKFIESELMTGPQICGVPDEGYLFFIRCKKPGAAR